MMKRLVLAGMTMVAVVLIAASPASASSPAAPGKQIITINCEGLGWVTVSVQRGQNSNGAGQIVGMKGHGIPTSFSTTVTDVTTGQVIFTDSSAQGGGHAHSQQSTVSCTFEEFEGLASDVFGTQLPPGVAPTDTVRGDGTVDVVLKL